MNWYKYEKLKWSWCIGFNQSYNMFFAQAWRELKEPVLIEGRKVYRECFTEFDKSLLKAQILLQQKLDQL